MSWTAVLVGCGACYALKLLGVSVPQRWLAGPRLQRAAVALPVALLAALVALQTWSDGRSLTVDARTGAVAVAGLAVLLRAPFVVVVVLAAATAALLRLA